MIVPEVRSWWSTEKEMWVKHFFCVSLSRTNPAFIIGQGLLLRENSGISGAVSLEKKV